MKCPKCSSEARDVARFCPRCHATLRFECPACHHEQREGGKCEKCGVDFMKYLSAIIVVKKGESEVAHDKLQQRSSLLKNLLLLPFDMGWSFIRDMRGSRKSSRF
ncbi:MAG: double zinc ribbon domain-containing protein [Candidatus Acidiferrales bacterium]